MSCRTPSLYREPGHAVRLLVDGSVLLHVMMAFLSVGLEKPLLSLVVQLGPGVMEIL